MADIHRSPLFNPLAKQRAKTAEGDPFGREPLPEPPPPVAPFAEYDWPLAKPQPPKTAAGESVPIAPTIETPFAQYDWPLSCRVKLNATGEPRGQLHDLPGAQYDWPLSARGRKAAEDWLNRPTPEAAPVTTPFAQYDWPLSAPRARKAAEDWFNNWPMPAEPAVEATFAQYDWPLPTRRLLGTRGEPVAPPPAIQTPFAQYDWVGAVRAQQKAIGEVSGPLAAAAAVPFSQADWPLPRLGRAKATGEAFATAPAIQTPFAQHDWVAATRARQKAAGETAWPMPEPGAAPEVPAQVITKGLWPKVIDRKGKIDRDEKPKRPSVREDLEAAIKRRYGPWDEPVTTDEGAQPIAPRTAEPLTDAQRTQVMAAMLSIAPDTLYAYGLDDALEAAVKLIRDLQTDEEEAIVMIIAATL